MCGVWCGCVCVVGVLCVFVVCVVVVVYCYGDVVDFCFCIVRGR